MTLHPQELREQRPNRNRFESQPRDGVEDDAESSVCTGPMPLQQSSPEPAINKSFFFKRLFQKLRKSKSRRVKNDQPRNAVLLLFSMDGTNRFELLSLQSIRETATVANVFEHVSSCKEEALKQQSYQGILTASCDTLIPMSERVFPYCEQNSVLVAVPSGANEISCTRSAVTLLSDSAIAFNLELHGFNASGWLAKPKQQLQFRSEASTSKSFRLKSRPFWWRMGNNSSSISTPDASEASI